MFQWSDFYNAKTILEQVFEAPYEWFHDYWSDCEAGHECLGHVLAENPNEDRVDDHHITAQMIDDVIIPTYTAWMNLPPDHPRFRSFAHWIEDLDANDVDAILQRAIFGEIVYG